MPSKGFAPEGTSFYEKMRLHRLTQTGGRRASHNFFEGGPIQRFDLKEGLSNRLQLSPVFHQDASGAIISRGDDPLDFAVNFLGSFFAVITLFVQLAAQEHRPTA